MDKWECPWIFKKSSLHVRTLYQVESSNFIQTQLDTWLAFSRFILGGVYGLCYSLCHFDKKFPPRCLLILIKRPRHLKMHPCKEKLKNRAARHAKIPFIPKKSYYYVKYVNSKLGPKTMKLAIGIIFSCKNQKQKQSSDWYSQDDGTPI